MRLGYFAMPVHPLHRNYTETLKEDRNAIIFCDELGFYDAFMGEHLSDAAENITSSMLFHATLIHSTKQIKLATGTTNLSHLHPTLVATHAAMFDHLAEGRFIMGISPGALTSDAEALGILDEDRNQMFAEAIDVILEIWQRDPTLQDRSSREPVQGDHRADAVRGNGRRDHAEAVSGPASGNCRYGCGTIFQRCDRHGQAGFPSVISELPARQMGCPPTGTTTRRARKRLASKRTLRTGVSHGRSLSLTMMPPRKAMARTMQRAPIVSTTTSFIRS